MTAAAIPIPAVSARRFTRVQRVRIWWHQRRLRALAKAARGRGLVLLEASRYHAAIEEIVEIDAIVQQSGSLPQHLSVKRKLTMAVRDALMELTTAEKLASEKTFLPTLNYIAATREKLLSNRERKNREKRRQVAVRPNLIDAVSKLNAPDTSKQKRRAKA